MTRLGWWGISGLLGIGLAALVGLIGWTATRSWTQPVPMPRVAVVHKAPERDAAVFDGPPVDSVGAPVPIARLMRESRLTQGQLDRVEWTGGGIVSCDISDVAPDPTAVLTVGVPGLLDRWTPVDLESVSSGQRWPLLYIVAQRSDGRAKVRVEGDTTALLTVAWTGANAAAPVPCQVVDYRPATPIHVHMRDYTDTADSMVGIVGCGQAVEVSSDGVQPFLVAEPCEVWGIRSVGVGTSYSKGVMLSPDGPASVEIDLPGYPSMIDPVGLEWVLDRLAQEGSEQVEDAVLELVDALTDPGDDPAGEIRDHIDEIGTLYEGGVERADRVWADDEGDD